ncbi:MAG: 4Fe-4S binding protein [Lachnospiraceae bacterium]
MKNKKWYNYLWIVEITYFILGFFNILFAWFGMIFFITPLLISIMKGNKNYCNKYCGRGQLFAKLGKRISRNKPLPKFMRTMYFRYGFLVFFMVMFFNMVLTTYFVFSGATNLSEVVTLLWTFKLPWAFTNTVNVAPWIAQYAYGFYSVMLTSTIIGIVTMVLFKPRGFCVYCPMGTMTQGICKLKNRGE